jgi:ADP-ribose pyrophosphatase YjhB (NUDIX family)
MRETLEPGESLEAAVRRGLKEEFGIRAKIQRYLGSFTGSFRNWQGKTVQKTTLYFLCRLLGTPKKTRHIENHYGVKSAREWQKIGFLKRQMKKQGRLLGRSDFNESAILERL